MRVRSHLHLLRALVGDQYLGRAYEDAFATGYLWHEFGDIHFIMPQNQSVKEWAATRRLDLVGPCM